MSVFSCAEASASRFRSPNEVADTNATAKLKAGNKRRKDGFHYK